MQKMQQNCSIVPKTELRTQGRNCKNKCWLNITKKFLHLWNVIEQNDMETDEFYLAGGF